MSREQIHLVIIYKLYIFPAKLLTGNNFYHNLFPVAIVRKSLLDGGSNVHINLYKQDNSIVIYKL